MARPFEVPSNYLRSHLNAMIDVTFADLQSQFLILPKGPGYVEYGEFQRAYEVLKRTTDAFSAFTVETIWAALREDSLTLVVLRTILGLTPPEWAEVARSELGSDVSQNNARALDARCRTDRAYLTKLDDRRHSRTLARVQALVGVAARYIRQGAPSGAADSVHRLAKVDTAEGLTSLRHIAAEDVPYAVLLYERYLGRPFASYRDAISELVGEVMERAIEARLAQAGITYRKTRRAERVPGFQQAPDFFVPDEFSAAVVIEAKIAGDDGTARDKSTRILRLCEIRDTRIRQGLPGFEVVACIDGRGFGVRRADMEQVLLRTGGKVFTLATLDHLIHNTRLRQFVSAGQIEP